MTLINNPHQEKAKQLITKSKPPIIIQAQDDSFNRKLLEYGNFQILLSPELGSRQDKLKYLDSGLNETLAKIAAKNNIAIGINLQSIQNLNKKQKAIRLSRIKQNIKICKKAKTKITFYPHPDNPKQAFSLLITLGASSQQAKEAISQ